LRAFKLPFGTTAFELDLEKLLASEQGANSKDFRISDYPSVSRDLTLTVATEKPHAQVEAAIHQILADYIHKVQATSIYQAEGGATKNLSFHLEFASPDKTLTKDEIRGIMKQLEAIN
jgi:phenylalanyl-tRNA synthetase beta chain